MSIDLTTELNRIEEYDETHPDHPNNKPAAANAEYDNAYVETATVENMEPIETIVAEEVVVDTPDRADEAMKYDERSAAQSPGEAAASLHSGGDAAKSASGSVQMLDREDDGMKYDERSSALAPSEAAATLHSTEAILAAETPDPLPPTPMPDPTATAPDDDKSSLIDSAQDTWQSLQTGNSAEYLDRAQAYVVDFFNTNRQLIIALGVVFLGIISLKLLFAGLNAIDDIPLVSPLLKIIGLFYTARFVWRYLIREQDRQELRQAIDRTKTEIFGS
jgi:hypothetical protein